MIILTSAYADVATKIVPRLPKPPNRSRLAFTPTAADPYENRSWMEKDRDALVGAGFHLIDVDLKGQTAETLRTVLNDVDILFVAGGSVLHLLKHARSSGFLSLLPELVAGGVVYIGSSAGSILTGPSMEPFVREERKEFPSLEIPTDLRAANLVPFIVLPHSQNPDFAAIDESYTIPTFRERFEFRRITDDQALIVHGEDVELMG